MSPLLPPCSSRILDYNNNIILSKFREQGISKLRLFLRVNTSPVKVQALSVTTLKQLIQYILHDS